MVQIVEGQPQVAAVKFPIYRMSQFNWRNWVPETKLEYTLFIGIDDTVTPAVYSLRYTLPGVAGGIGQTSELAIDQFLTALQEVQDKQATITTDFDTLNARLTQFYEDADRIVAEISASAVDASKAAAESKDWASLGEDTPVDESGEFSAKHYAIKAATTYDALIGDEDIMNAANNAAIASESARVSRLWATGSDPEVQELEANEHSSRTYSNMAMASATLAEQSANLAEQYATQATQFSGRIIQLGFDGSLEDDTLVFKHAPSGIDVPYDLLDDHEYEIDMAYFSTESLPNDTKIVIKNGTDTINFVSALHRDSTTPVTVGDMNQVMRFNDATGYRWLFKAAFKVTPAGNKVFLLYPVISLASSGLEIGDIGIAPFGVDESLNLRRYLNGQVISQEQFKSFTDKIKKAVELYPNLSATEENWQAEVTASVLGQCGKFVIDDTAGTIRLPKVVNINGLQDLALLGGIKAESLPNHKHYEFADIRQGYKTLSSTLSPVDQCSFDSYGDYWISGNATESSIGLSSGAIGDAYQDNAPVQQEAVQYPYFIQVATGSEETLPAISEYKLNNPNFFGQSMWTDVTPNNASWLLSNGAFHSGATYADYYEWLLKIYNGTETVEGVSVKSSTDTYDDYDFVINTADTTFRLPLISGRILVAKKEATTEDSTWYNWYSDGWLEQGATIAVSGNGTTKIDFRHSFKNNSYFVNISGQAHRFTFGVNEKTENYVVVNHYQDHGATDSSLVSVSVCASGYAEIPNKSEYTEVKGLYFYVGDTLQDPALINAGAVLNDVAELKGHTIVETYRNGTEWYDVYADGRCEQGGIIDVRSFKIETLITIHLLKPYINTDYSVFTQLKDGANMWANVQGSNVKAFTTSSFNLHLYEVASTASVDAHKRIWKAKGYIR